METVNIRFLIVRYLFAIQSVYSGQLDQESALRALTFISNRAPAEQIMSTVHSGTDFTCRGRGGYPLLTWALRHPESEELVGGFLRKGADPNYLFPLNERQLGIGDRINRFHFSSLLSCYIDLLRDVGGLSLFKGILEKGADPNDGLRPRGSSFIKNGTLVYYISDPLPDHRNLYRILAHSVLSPNDRIPYLVELLKHGADWKLLPPLEDNEQALLDQAKRIK